MEIALAIAGFLFLWILIRNFGISHAIDPNREGYPALLGIVSGLLLGAALLFVSAEAGLPLAAVLVLAVVVCVGSGYLTWGQLQKRYLLKAEEIELQEDQIREIIPTTSYQIEQLLKEKRYTELGRHLESQVAAIVVYYSGGALFLVGMFGLAIAYYEGSYFWAMKAILIMLAGPLLFVYQRHQDEQLKLLAKRLKTSNPDPA